MRTSNPVLNVETFAGASSLASGRMTIQGAIYKTNILLFLAVISGSFTWKMVAASNAEAMPWILGGALGGFLMGIVTCFKKEWAPVTAPIYALLEGLALGGISAFYQARFPGIVFNAVGLTFCTLFALLIAYQAGIVRATDNFKRGVVAATLGIALVYLVSIILHLFGIAIPYIHESGAIGIGFSVFVVIIAALNLVLDFDLIEEGANSGAPKYMEWYAGFGLMVTLVWLYLEMLRLLSKLNSRR